MSLDFLLQDLMGLCGIIRIIAVLDFCAQFIIPHNRREKTFNG